MDAHALRAAHDAVARGVARGQRQRGARRPRRHRLADHLGQRRQNAARHTQRARSHAHHRAAQPRRRDLDRPPTAHAEPGGPPAPLGRRRTSRRRGSQSAAARYAAAGSTKQVYVHPTHFSGRTPTDKLKELRSQLTQQRAASIVVTALDEVAWLFDLRGSDIPFNPVFFAYGALKASCAHPSPCPSPPPPAGAQHTHTHTHIGGRGPDPRARAATKRSCGRARR